MLSIRKLTATFGRLEDQTLELHRGLNVITGGNETGKTTWAEFILAMFYGVDTRARARGDQLPVKTRYLPWNGKPMAGRMELETDSGRLVLERSSGASPLSELTVRDGSGNTVSGLNAVHCGETLLGAEAGVFRRSGCLIQRQAAVSADGDLEKRLNSLVTTGSEEYSFADLDAKLKRMQNDVRYNQTGELPRARAEREQVRDSLRRCDELSRQLTGLSLRISHEQDREAELSEISEGIAQLERQTRQDAVRESREALQQAEEEMRRWETVCAELPPQEDLDGLRRELKSIRDTAQTAAMEEGLDRQDLPSPPEDPAFYQFNAQQAAEKAAEDARFVAENLAPRKPAYLRLALFLLPGLAALIAGILLLVLEPLPDFAKTLGLVLTVLGAVAVLGMAFRFYRRLSAENTSRQAARNLLTWYEAHSSGEILEKAEAYGKSWEQYQERQAQFRQSMEDRSARAAELSERTSALLDRVRAFVPGCDTLEQAEAWLQEAAFASASLEQARRMSVSRRTALERLQTQELPEPDPAEDLTRFRQYDPAAIRADLERCTGELRSLRSDADRISGALEQLGDPYVLNAELEALDAREKSLQERYDAISMARAALSQADEQLRSRFSPMLCKRAGEIFSMLTEGRYDRISLDREFRVRIHPAGSTLDRPLSCFSGGTADQLYLALRLAICDLLLPEVPIILDDALVYFDDQRALLALKTLKALARTRQILLFTCQSREKRLLDSLQPNA